MLKAGVIGWPLSHSLSPRLHMHWLKKYGIEGEYVAMPVAPEGLAEALSALRQRKFRGCNLTVPHKEKAVALMDSLDAAAKAIGAVNTIVVMSDGTLAGSNTDAYGFAENLRLHSLPHKRKAVVLGAGGAARAICHALLAEGFAEIALANRTLRKAETLAAHFGPACRVAGWQKRDEALEGASLLVNATSLGMTGNEPLDIDLSALPEDAVVCDIVYVPLETPLLAQAKRRGNPVVDGLGMLIHQAVPGFEAWFGVRPEADAAARAALLEGL